MTGLGLVLDIHPKGRGFCSCEVLKYLCPTTDFNLVSLRKRFIASHEVCTCVCEYVCVGVCVWQVYMCELVCIYVLCVVCVSVYMCVQVCDLYDSV